MKTELEKITHSTDSSLQLMVNPNLSDFFFWHFHPEFELVYIEGADGTRHVGDHISKFTKSDLVLIGSYIPHLNFDYGVKTSYEKIVVHIRPDFLKGSHVSTPELAPIHRLFELSKHGVAFGKVVQKEVSDRLKMLDDLSHFEQFLELLSILKILEESDGKELLHQNPVKNKFTRKDQERMQRIYNFIDHNYQRNIEVGEAAKVAYLTEAAFCRYFKRTTKLTFTQFVNHYRIDKAKKLLLQDRSVTETCYDCGFESLSYFNRTFKKVTGKAPTQFKKSFIST